MVLTEESLSPIILTRDKFGNFKVLNRPNYNFEYTKIFIKIFWFSGKNDEAILNKYW